MFADGFEKLGPMIGEMDAVKRIITGFYPQPRARRFIRHYKAADLGTDFRYNTDHRTRKSPYGVFLRADPRTRKTWIKLFNPPDWEVYIMNTIQLAANMGRPLRAGHESWENGPVVQEDDLSDNTQSDNEESELEE